MDTTSLLFFYSSIHSAVNVILNFYLGRYLLGVSFATIPTHITKNIQNNADNLIVKFYGLHLLGQLANWNDCLLHKNDHILQQMV